MKRQLIILLLCTFVISSGIYAQANGSKTKFWKLYSHYGEIKLNGFYRNQVRTGNGIKEKQQSTMYAAGILLRTKNYIWSPKFIVIDLDGEYTPDKSNEKYLVIPDQAENRDIRKFDARLTFLPQNRFSIGSYFNYGRVYNNRENLSNMRATGTNWGSTLYYRTKKYPFSVGYTSWNQDEVEIQTGRKFKNQQHNIEGRVNSSFGKTDRQELLASYNTFYRKDFIKNEVSINIKNLSYNGLFFFGAGKRNTINTLLSAAWQQGNEIFTRYQAIENMNIELKRNLKLGTNYLFYADHRPQQTLAQHKIGGNLQHQLFQSLHSQIAYDYITTNQTQYNSILHNGFADLVYTKKILKKHELDLSYRYNWQAQKWNSQDGLLNIINESITLKDGQISLLARPYITTGSIRLKDATGSIIYQENLDYLLVIQNQFIQVQRIPGGLIPNNTAVFADYTAVQPGTYQYNSTNTMFAAGLSFFNRLLNIYYRKSVQDYDHLKKIDFVTLNYYNQQVFGVGFEYKFFTGGAEYDNMNSTVLPYRLYRYYINLQGAVKKKILLAVNANLYDYKILNNVKNIQFVDVNGTATYHIIPRLTLSASLTYRKQKGVGVDLDLLGFRSELTADIHKLRFWVMYNYYDRTISNEKIQFNAVNVQIARKF